MYTGNYLEYENWNEEAKIYMSDNLEILQRGNKHHVETIGELGAATNTFDFDHHSLNGSREEFEYN